MNVAGLKKFCAGLHGATEQLYGAPYNILVFQVGGKTFAYFKTSAPERWRFSVRVSPDRYLELTDRSGIKPARYRGRYHWVTIVGVRSVPSDYLVELVEASYRRALGGLSRTRQNAVAARETPGRTLERR